MQCTCFALICSCANINSIHNSQHHRHKFDIKMDKFKRNKLLTKGCAFLPVFVSSIVCIRRSWAFCRPRCRCVWAWVDTCSRDTFPCAVWTAWTVLRSSVAFPCSSSPSIEHLVVMIKRKAWRKERGKEGWMEERRKKLKLNRPFHCIWVQKCALCSSFIHLPSLFK